MRLEKEFYWRDFLEEVDIEISKCIASLHFAYEKRNDAIFHIQDYKDVYIQAGINIDRIYDIDNENKIHFNNKQADIIGVKIMSYIRSYNYLVYERIPELNNRITTFSKIRHMPTPMYTYLQEEVNYNIQKHIVKGNYYSFGSKIGFIYPYVHKFPKNSICKYIDWKESKKLKKLLEERGLAIMTPDNPKGIQWKVLATYPFCVKACYKRRKGRIPESRYYKFRFGYTPGMPYKDKPRPKVRPSDLKGITFDEILDNRQMNCFNKILGVVVNIPDLRYSLYKNNVNTNLTNYDGE